MKVHKTKELVERTALRLFVEKGVNETTIKDISQAAGIAEGTLYRHFRSKDDLAWELFSKNYIACAHELDKLQQEQPTMRGKLSVMIHYFCDLFDRDPFMFSYLLLSQHAHLHKVTSEIPSPVRLVIEVIEDGMARGELPQGDPHVAAAMGLGLVLEVAVFKIYGRITQSLASLADRLTQACLQVLHV
jgi:AcrR family transcriptional regulator